MSFLEATWIKYLELMIQAKIVLSVSIVTPFDLPMQQNVKMLIFSKGEINVSSQNDSFHFASSLTHRSHEIREDK